MIFQNSLQFAQEADKQDELAHFRKRFIFPQHDGEDSIYLCGNSLGLQPITTRDYLNHELEQWATYGVEGHFKGERPWKDYHHFFKEKMAKVVGGKPVEVTVMNTLTVNLNLLMYSFYNPTPTRFKVMMEAGAFPSDQYAVEMLVRSNGFKPEDAIIELAPRSGEHTLRTEDILSEIERHGSSLAMIMIGGVNYYTGQCYDMQAITQAGHKTGAIVGFDLAHAAGNIPVKLHDWDVDFATWCGYKYLNCGPGGASGIFVNERFANQADLPRQAGWWGHEEENRFKMRKGFIPMTGADGWQQSNAQIFAMAPLLASLEIFEEAGMDKLRAKSEKLTGYLFFLLEEIARKKNIFEIITPQTAQDRGCQISLLTGSNGKKLFEYLTDNGVIADWREPNVIRVAPTPLYNSFEDVWRFASLMDS